MKFTIFNSSHRSLFSWTQIFIFWKLLSAKRKINSLFHSWNEKTLPYSRAYVRGLESILKFYTIKNLSILLIFKTLMENLVRNNTTVGFFRFINFFKSYNTIYIYMYIFSENFTIYIGIYAIITFDKFDKSKKTNCSVVRNMLRMIYFEFSKNIIIFWYGKLLNKNANLGYICRYVKLSEKSEKLTSSQEAENSLNYVNFVIQWKFNWVILIEN